MDSSSALDSSSSSTLDSSSSSTLDSSVSSCSSDYELLSSSEDSNVSGMAYPSSSTDSDTDASNEHPTTPDSESTDPLSQPLYDGAEITLLDSYMLVMQHSLRHSLTKQAFSDLLKVIGMLLPSKSMVSYYRLRKFFLDLYGDITFTKRYCCANCHSSLDDKEAACCNGCERSTAIEFLTVSVAAQLKRKLEGIIILHREVGAVIIYTVMDHFH